MTPSSPRIDAGLWALCAAAFAFAAVLMMPVVLAGDALYWHVTAGRWMIDNQAVLRINLFSYAFAGDPWQNLDWLSELMLALAYVGAGWGGVLVLAALAAAAAAGLLAFHLARGRSGWLALTWLGLAFATGGGAVQALPFLLALPCLVAWTAGLCRTEGPSLKLLPVMLLWANLSGSFVIGLILTVFLAAEAIAFAGPARRDIARRWGVFTGYSLVLGLITPTGLPGFLHAVRALSLIGPVTGLWPLLLGLPAAAMLLPQPRMAFRLAFLAGLFVLALTSAAGRAMFAAAAPLLAAGPALAEPVRFKLRPAFTLLLIALLAAGGRLLVPVPRVDDAFSPRTAFAAVPAAVKRLPVLNETAFGGFLIFHEVKPFLDGRPVYSAATRRRYGANADPALLKNTLTRYHIRWTILKPSDPVTAAMDAMPGWHRSYADQWAVVHVRNDAQ